MKEKIKVTAQQRANAIEALDAVEVHPCDVNNDSIRAKGLHGSMAALHAALAAPLQQGEYLPMTSAPKDGSLIRMLVKFEDHPLDDDDQPQWTVGFNNLSNTQVDEWQFVGWSWQSDLFCDGTGTPIGWLPMLDAARGAAQAAPAPVAEDAEDAARYRWLREQCQPTGHLTIAKSNSWELQPWSGDDPDSVIDAARAQAAQPEGGA